MILFVDAFDNGSDHPDWTENGFYDIDESTGRWILMVACGMFSETYNRIYDLINKRVH